MNIYTFWEGPMPGFIKLCMDTWKFPYTVLNYDNLHNYTDFDIEPAKRFTLPQISDIVRVHVLRDQGGCWLDTDTIMLTGKLPKADFIGYPERRGISCAYLRTEPNTDMFIKWAEHQERVVHSSETPTYWATFANQFPEPYLQEHPDMEICPIDKSWPETYMVREDIPRYIKYRRFYFEQSNRLSDIKPADLLMLHNSWTPEWYKDLTADEVLAQNCTMSNILREVLCGT